ncbi:TPA: LysR family transcriptional regulator [Klebsiella pneumoniae]
MRIDDIDALLATVQFSSLNQAAEYLGITQSAITRRLQRLEQELNVTLLERQTRPLTLTAAGHRVYEQCLSIKRETKKLYSLLDPQGEPRGALRLGVPQSLSEIALPAALTALRQQMAEQAASLDASGEFPWRNIDHLRAGGWLSLAVPPSCGGAGASLAQLQQVIAAIAWGEPATALIVCMQYLHHLRLAENDAWHAPLRQQVFHDAVEHGGLINSLRVEPELGSPARGGLPDTVATRRAEGWDISGHKIYTTGIEGLRWLAVWARSDDNPPLVGTWLVPGDSPGITVVKSWDHAGMRATGSHEVIFNHVRVAAEHAVDVWPADAPPAAEAEPFRLFANRQTALLAAIYDSIAHAAHDWLVRWLAGRVPAGLGHPLSRLPRVQEKVGQIAGLLLVNRSLLEQAAALRFSAIEANLAKVTITDNAIQAVNIALELTGNHGLSRQNPLERHYRNVLCGRVHTPQSDSAWLAAGNFVFQSQG